MIDFVNIYRYRGETAVDGVLRVKNREYWFQLVDDNLERREDEIVERRKYYVFNTPEHLLDDLIERRLDPFSLRLVGTSINLDEVDWYN